MSYTIQLNLDLPGDLARLKLPKSLDAYLTRLLDKQDSGVGLSTDERVEAEELVDLAETLTYLRLRAERAA